MDERCDGLFRLSVMALISHKDSQSKSDIAAEDSVLYLSVPVSCPLNAGPQLTPLLLIVCAFVDNNSA